MGGAAAERVRGRNGATHRLPGGRLVAEVRLGARSEGPPPLLPPLPKRY